MAAPAGERDAERGSPGTCTQDSDAAQATADLEPKRFSVPARSLRMF
jgi:hypothetical protein